LGGAPLDLVVGAGSDEVICILMNALSEPPPGRGAAVVLSVEPSFVMYRHNAIVCGLRPVSVPLTGAFGLDGASLQKAIADEKPNLIFLASPNNPTGNAFSDGAIREVIEAAPSSLVVIDEAYAAFAGRTLSTYCERYDNVALMGTLSKIGLAGARVGYCRLPSAIAADVDKARQPFNLSSLALCAGELALTDLAPILEAQVDEIIAERARLFAALERRDDLEPHPSDANFILVRVRGDAAAFASRLNAEGVGVRAFAGVASLEGHVRITVGTPDQNDALLAAL
jgi:histidinol-phosphate aminotransferase